jgi:hypothetical protein
MKSYLSEEEIIALTGYQQPERQIKVLRSRGFTRVFRGPKGNVVVEWPHFEAVSSGRLISNKPNTVRLAFLKGEK